ncbi:uncharacterized protein V1518DRAFT_437958 [Limtongia smithiae]|uniref:uncharacterized protein n=1 Tax=Limtongia smithiae TaxID=1125753 RepID=UPI0034CE8B74
MKQRIIQHMNKDHALSLRDYLEYYKGIQPTRKIEMRDITTEYVLIGYEIVHNKGIDQLEAKIEFKPPMKSLAEARDVLVGMALQASEGLGYATVSPVDSFLLPRWRSYPVIAIVAVGLYFVVFNTSYIDAPGTLIRQYTVKGIEIVPILIRLAFYLMVMFHAMECLTMFIWTGAYRVPSLKRAAWVASAFFEGWPALARFRSLMEEKDKASEKTKSTVDKKK